MRTRQSWLGGTTPRNLPQGWSGITTTGAWRGPVAALAAGALLSVPAVAGAPAARAAPFGSTTPSIRQAALVRAAAGARLTGVQRAGASNQQVRPAGGPHSPGRAAAIAGLRLVPVDRLAGQSGHVTARPAPPARPRPGASDGMLVAAIGTALAGAGWLLLLAAGRRLRRRSR
jgi:hypothetical protein